MQTIYSYYDVGLNYKLAEDLGFKHSHSKIGWKMNMPQHVTKGKICMRIDRPSKNHTGPYTYKVSFSFCAPSENFNRSIGRKICNCRMESGVFVTFNSKTPKTLRQISEHAIGFIAQWQGKYNFNDAINVESGLNLPRWFVRATRDDVSPEYRWRKNKLH